VNEDEIPDLGEHSTSFYEVWDVGSGLQRRDEALLYYMYKS
jgi:hypothetical protein